VTKENHKSDFLRSYSGRRYQYWYSSVIFFKQSLSSDQGKSQKHSLSKAIINNKKYYYLSIKYKKMTFDKKTIYICIIIFIVLIIIIVPVVYWYVNSTYKLNTDTNSTTYTPDEIKTKWIATGCTQALPQDVITNMTSVDKLTADQMIIERSIKICKILDPYTPAQINELQSMWVNSKCPAAFPMNYIIKLNKYNNYSDGKQIFTKYISDILQNDKDDVMMSRDYKYAACYGADWSNNKDLLTQSNTKL